jgi:hypothetical protein
MRQDPTTLLARILFLPIHILFGGLMIVMTWIVPAPRRD